MAQTTKTSAEQKLLTVIANVRAKFAELDALDNEFADLDAALPMDDMGGGGDQFNLLSEKREELETEIRAMRERVQLISEWEKFKGTGWSDEVQTELNALDSQFSAIADGASDAGMGAPPMPDMPMAPETPMVPEAPISPAAPVAPEVPAVDATADLSADPALEPMPDAAVDAPIADPLAAPIASSKNAQIKEKINYELQDKKGSATSAHLKKGDNTMANTSNLSLKEKLAEAKSKREAIEKEARTRVASAYTIAKTLLPSAPAAVQASFTASLLAGNSTKVIKAALRQTAINAHYQKMAETFKEVHGVELNDPSLMEDPSVLNAEKKAVESELKGKAIAAGAKKADDTKETGPQEGTYDDGRDGSEPKELDASKAAERPDAGKNPGQTQNLSDGETKAAAAKKACVGADCAGCKNADCKGKKANAKKADGEFPEEAAPVAEAPLPEEAAAPEAPEEIEAPAELPPAVPENPEAEAAEILTDEKKNVLEEKITEAQDAISAIEQEILSEGDEGLDLAKLEGEEDALGDLDGLDGEEGAEEEISLEEVPEGEDGEGEELDFSKVFDPEGMDEKAASLANEGEEKSAGGEDDFFGPSAASNLEASMDDDGMGDMHDMFSLQGSDGDPLASLIAGLKSAAEVAGMELIPSSTGEAADHFESEEATGEDRDNENDHSGNLFFEALDSITPEAQGAKRTTQDSTNELELPKAAAKATLKKIRTASGSDKTPRFDIGSALFGNDDE